MQNILMLLKIGLSLCEISIGFPGAILLISWDSLRDVVCAFTPNRDLQPKKENVVYWPYRISGDHYVCHLACTFLKKKRKI